MLGCRGSPLFPVSPSVTPLTPSAPPELHRCAVFLLLQVGAEIHDTPTVLVDRTLTDICFEGAVLL